jgi:EAL domain-containing protein (putative c-di-GMP-specific phosphodiesterase class I)
LDCRSAPEGGCAETARPRVPSEALTDLCADGEVTAMQTQAMPNASTASDAGPWLERAAPEGVAPNRVHLTKFPFTIGRLAPADLLVNSSRVSREHAVIHCREGHYVVYDRGSTNGTFVNGQRIQESELTDGDTLVIADIEFTFGGSRTNADEETTTQALRSTRATQVGGLDLIRAVRRLHEVVTLRCLPPRLAPIVRLADDQTVAYEALGGRDTARVPRELAEAECRLTMRLQHLARLTAVEQSLSLLEEEASNGAPTHDARLFIGIVATEMGAEDLADSLLQLGHAAGRDRLVVELPDSAISDAPMLRTFCERLRSAGIGIAHVGFSAGGGQLRQRKDFAPDYLKLVGSLARQLDQSGPRRRQVQEIVAAAGELGAEVIVAGVRREEEAAASRELGCGLAAGPYFSQKDRHNACGHGTAVCFV